MSSNNYQGNSTNYPDNVQNYPINPQKDPPNYNNETPVSSTDYIPSHPQPLSTLRHPYAPSYTPSRTEDVTLPTRGRSDLQVYHHLHYPSASNNGSMKKKKRLGAEGGATESSSRGISDSLPHLEREDGDQDVRVW